MAELLEKLIPSLREAKVDAEWRVIEGGSKFFGITKSIHNALHGAEETFTPDMFEHYLAINQRNAEMMQDLRDADLVVIHDPQPAGMIRYFPKRKGKWIWRCHIDISSPDPTLWSWLKGVVSLYDAVVFHSDRFAKKDLMLRQFIVPPAIDPLSPKNTDLSNEEVRQLLQKHRIDTKKPLISQIGRFDRLKDPEGVVKVFQQVREPGGVVDVLRSIAGKGVLDVTKLGERGIKCQLVLAGGLAADDPEGQEVFESVSKLAGRDKDIRILALPPHADIDINAIQRASSVVLQKSLREGFALTVSEALWKGVPVIGGNAGGIPLQIIDGVNGFLVNSIEEAVDRVRFVLRNREKAVKIGQAGREHVRKNFLITRYVRDHLLTYLTLELIPRKLVQL